jgi:cystathionine beta-lyase/cystathionine gamma-synthase
MVPENISMEFETACIHAGQQPDPSTGAIMAPVYHTSTYVQEGVGKHRGYDYARTGNPTRSVLEANLATLEAGQFGLAFASGMAAIDTILRLLKPGDHVLAGNDVYGGTYRLFERVFRLYGLDFSYVDTTDLEQVTSNLQTDTRLVWIETPSNPLLNVSDITSISRAAHQHASPILVVVDNTFATPYLQRPLTLGADLVVHSTTKYLGGHSDVVGGVVIGQDEALHKRLSFLQNAVGAVPGPMDCFLTLRGIKTLPVRMDRHATNAARVADYLSAHPAVQQVYYPFQSSHPQSELAHQQMRSGGGMVSFIMKGGASEAIRVAESTHIFALAESLGGVESLIEVPAAMTHTSTTNSPIAVSPSLVRLSVGIENIDDLLADLSQALG